MAVFPGGGIGLGERPEEALMREIIGEVGLSVCIQESVGQATRSVFSGGEGYFAICANLFERR